MTIEISQVYKSLLAKPKQSLNFQKKIYYFGLKTKNADLLARLASHPDLHHEVDSLLKTTDYAAVKAAWASRDGRKLSELEDLVKGETRVKILQALAEKENLPEQVYIAIATQCKGQGALTALCLNQSIDNEIRVLAAKNLAEKLDSKSESKTSKTENTISMILTSFSDLADTFVEYTSNKSAIIIAAGSGYLQPKNQRKVAEIINSSANNLEKESNPYGYHSYSWIPDTVKSMTSFGKIDDEASKIICQSLAILKKYHETRSNTYYSDEVKEAIKKVKDSTSKPFVDYVKAVNECKSREEISDLVLRLKVLISNSSRSSLNIRTEAVALAVIASPFSDVTLVDDVSSWLTWYTYRQATKMTNDYHKLAILLYHFPYLGYESVLSKSSDPHKCLEILISTFIEKSTQIPSELLASKFMNKEIVSKLPLSVLYNETLPGFLLEMIGDMLENGLTSDNAWVTFESLGSDFNGTIEDLVHISKSI